MTPSELLRDLSRRGVELEAYGDRLRFRPAERLSASDIHSIRQHNSELLVLLGADDGMRHDRVRLHGPCTRCGAEEHLDVPIHNGRSLRRDCSRCRLTKGFPRWNPSPLSPLNEGPQTP